MADTLSVFESYIHPTSTINLTSDITASACFTQIRKPLTRCLFPFIHVFPYYAYHFSVCLKHPRKGAISQLPHAKWFWTSLCLARLCRLLLQPSSMWNCVFKTRERGRGSFLSAQVLPSHSTTGSFYWEKDNMQYNTTHSVCQGKRNSTPLPLIQEVIFFVYQINLMHCQPLLTCGHWL